MLRALMAAVFWSIDEYLAARRALDERDQLEDAALARTGMAGEKHELAGLDAKLHARERLAAVGIALVDLLEADHDGARRPRS